MCWFPTLMLSDYKVDNIYILKSFSRVDWNSAVVGQPVQVVCDFGEPDRPALVAEGRLDRRHDANDDAIVHQRASQVPLWIKKSSISIHKFHNLPEFFKQSLNFESATYLTFCQTIVRNKANIRIPKH